MIQLSGYEINEQIYSSDRTLVYRGCRQFDQLPVIIKLMKGEYPTFGQIVQFRHQYTIAKNLDIVGIIHPYSLEKYHHSFALVMEDFGGISLKEWIEKLGNQKLSINEFLRIAIDITKILGQLHQSQVIHKDIKPTNILINPQTKIIKITDFSISSLLPRETQSLVSPNILEGTLAYISPEQTGRMNRGIDYRTDFYSLGITFYEMLTGQLAFTCQEPIELIHNQIAKPATPANQINPAIPTMIADIIAKLMAKNAEDRYQSAAGLIYDLEICLNQWHHNHNIDNFPLGIWDISERFIIPEKLYGRDKEVKILLAAFKRISHLNAAFGSGEKASASLALQPRLSSSEMMLVAGYSGIGKTAVINEVHKPIVQLRGYFIKGKFDQFQRNIPLLAIGQSFRDLISQLLTENSAELAKWKQKILTALGESGQVMIDLIPELELVIGKQSPAPHLEAGAAQNRFNLLLQKFVQVVAQPDHPLVIFLDDLQWADSASLKLIQLLMSQTENSCLLLIGAYRDHEVDPSHPLMLTLDEIRKNQAIVNTITLGPLSQTDLNCLVADTLKCSENMAWPLTQLVYQKTQGNPFFSNQFLKSLYDDGMISFNPPQSLQSEGERNSLSGHRQGGWQCNISQVQALALTDDVVEFMALQLQKLPKLTQNVLQLAACIGNSFDLDTLAIVSEKSLEETSVDLWRSLQEGLIIPQNENYKFYQDIQTDSHSSLSYSQIGNYPTPQYKFLHDRVQQAAYSLIEDNHKQAVHLKIGQLLLENTPENQHEERIFEIVNQLNLGIDLISEINSKLALAELNLKAGKKAKVSTAYTAATEYFTQGIKLLDIDSWETTYQLSLNLWENLAESSYLKGDFEGMEKAVSEVLEKTTNLLDQIKVYQVKIQAQIAQNQLQEGLNTGLKLLSLLGVDFPSTPTPEDVGKAIESMILSLQAVNIAELINLPLMTDPLKLATMRILSNITAASYIGRPLLYPLIILTGVNLSHQYGNTETSTFYYASYGLILAGVVGDIKGGNQWGELALNLSHKINAKEFLCRTSAIVFVFVKHWQEHLKYIVEPLKLAHYVGRETGDLEFASYSILNYSVYSYCQGLEISEIAQEMDNFSIALAQMKQKTILNYYQIVRQTLENLMIISDKRGSAYYQPSYLKGEFYDEDLMVPFHQQANDKLALAKVYFYKLTLAYLFGELEIAKTNALLVRQNLEAIVGFVYVPLFYFYDSLIALACWPQSDKIETDNLLKQVIDNQQKLEKWGHHAPMNYLHKFYLVEAERYRVLGENWLALEMYDRAIQIAQDNNYHNEEGLAHELAAKFYLSHGKKTNAQAYMINAYYAYTRWGAKAKIAQLEKLYPQLLGPILQTIKSDRLHPVSHLSTNINAVHTTQTISSLSTSMSKQIDLNTIIKASQALSEEIHLDKLLSTLMEVLIENAGASKGALLLSENDQLILVSQCFDSQNCQIESIPLESTQVWPVNLINYVYRSEINLIINDGIVPDNLANDPYLNQQKPKSIWCNVLRHQGKLSGLIYLENSLTLDAFTEERIELLKVLCTQTAISLENALLYQKSQDYAQKLEQSLHQLQQAQIQIVQNEKMATLGQLMAGLAHEINNPVGFIAGNVDPALGYVQDLIDYLELYHQNYPQPPAEITEKAEEIDLEFVLDDLPQMLKSMKEGTDRIKEISKSMRVFARSDMTKKTRFNIHEGIDSTLVILKHRLKANDTRPAIEIVKEYGKFPEIECYPGQLNQVFMNLIGNAVDAFDEGNQGKTFSQIQAKPNCITIKTELDNEANQIIIKFADNGCGMTPEVQAKVFDYLFTTKAVGKGTGLGLAICRQIIEEHGGKIVCNSVLGQGTEFIMNINT